MASTYHHLGVIAERQQEIFASAEQRYRKALAIKEKQGNEARRGERRITNWGTSPRSSAIREAEQWYHKAMAIWVRMVTNTMKR